MPPVVWRVLIYVAGWLVPWRARVEWRAQWQSAMANWWILAERGELADRGSAALARRLLADAVGQRFTDVRLRRTVRSPAIVIAVALASVLTIGFLSRGFTTSRWLIAVAQDVRARPDLGFPYDHRGDILFKYLAPMVSATGVGLALLVLSRRSMRSIGLRSWSLLIFKVVAAELISALLWVEGGRALRAHVAREGLRFGLLGIGLAFAYVTAFGYLIVWCVTDQRRRCPECLHRLVMPVTLGSWASIYDPAATELVCDEGHGSLAMQESETETGTPDRWTVLDSSWRELFR